MGMTARSPGLSSITARQWMILLSVQLSSLLFGMTITLANVVLPQIRGALSATYDEIAWVVTLNLSPRPLRHRRPVGWRAGSAGGASCSALSAASRYARCYAGSPTASPRSSFSASDRVSSER
jgi:hypothetical protein